MDSVSLKTGRSSFSEGLNNNRLTEMQSFHRDTPGAEDFLGNFRASQVDIQHMGVVAEHQDGEKEPSTTGINRDLSLAFKLFKEEQDAQAKPQEDSHSEDEEQSMTDQAISKYHSESQFYNRFVYGFTTLMHCFESAIDMILLLVLALFIACSLIAVVYQTYLCFRDKPHFILGPQQYHEWLDGVFYVLIGVELSKSVLAELGGDRTYVEVVGLVACTAIARSIVVQEYKANWDTILCMGMLIACLGISIRFIRSSIS